MKDGDGSPCYCYIVQCADNTYYTGWTTNLKRRVIQHNLGLGAKYTRVHGPVQLVYVEQLPGRSEAMKRERAIKALPRLKKEMLVHSYQANSTENE